MRGFARLISLLLLLLYLSLWLFNEDVRQQPSPQILWQGALTVALLLAWRWENAGGWLAIAGGAIFFVILILGMILRADMPLLIGSLVSAAMATPYIAAGILFVKIDQPARSVAHNAVGE